MERSTIFHGKTHYFYGHFSWLMLNYQRVTHGFVGNRGYCSSWDGINPGHPSVANAIQQRLKANDLQENIQQQQYCNNGESILTILLYIYMVIRTTL
jgi:hypothetical protein